MTDKINIVILAAGKGTRLKMDIPKPLCPFAGATLVDFVLKEVFIFCQRNELSAEIDLVVGHKKELIEDHIKKKFDSKVGFIHQKEQLGTGHALKTFFDHKPEAFKNSRTLVMCADTPMLKSSVLEELAAQFEVDRPNAIAATFKTTTPFGYGRIVRAKKGFSIIEEKDANAEEKSIQEVNSALYIFSTEHIKKHIANLNTNNKNNEFYLTDLFKPEFDVKPVMFDDHKYFDGVNSQQHLEQVQKSFMLDKINELQTQGVRFINSESVYIEDDVSINAGTVIYPNVCLFNGTRIGANCIVEPGTIIKNSQIDSEVTILANCYIESAKVESGTQLGPYARLRAGTELGKNCKIGNFVETKKARLDSGVKVSHLSYVGDAEVGADTNIGCGFITCNYDGANKHLTRIGKGSFIGSDCQMVAPIELGDEVYIASGSTINQDVPSGSFAIARQRQITKPDMAKKFLKKSK